MEQKIYIECIECRKFLQQLSLLTTLGKNKLFKIQKTINTINRGQNIKQEPLVTKHIQQQILYPHTKR